MRDKAKTKFINITPDLVEMVIIVAIIGIVIITVLSDGLSFQVAFLMVTFSDLLWYRLKTSSHKKLNNKHITQQLKTAHYAYR